MVLQYYVVENETGKQIEIDIESATNEDLTSTKEKWQSDWTSEFIRDPKLEKYAAKTDAGEIVALGAYREDDHGISVFIANIEAHHESNPTISTVPMVFNCQLIVGMAALLPLKQKQMNCMITTSKIFMQFRFFSHIREAQSCLC